MTQQTFQTRVDSIIRVIVERLDSSINPATLSAETRLIEAGLAFNSIMMLELVTGLEDDLDIMIDESLLEKAVFERIGTLARFLCEHCP